MLCTQGILNRHSRAERQSRTKLTVKPITEYNFYWQNITCTGRIWLILAEHDLYWLIVTLTGRIWLIGPYWHNTGRTWVILAERVIYTGRIRLILSEHDLYWLTVTLTGRIWLTGPYWQPIKSVLSFCSALPIQYTRAHTANNNAHDRVCNVLWPKTRWLRG